MQPDEQLLDLRNLELSQNKLQTIEKTNEKKEILQQNIQSHPQRYFIYVIFFLQIFFYGFLLPFYQVLYEQMRVAFGYEAYQIQQCYTAVFFAKLIILPFIIRIDDKCNFKCICIFGSLMFTISCVLKCLVSLSFNYVLLSMIICGFGGAIFISLEMKICYNWFTQKERKFLLPFTYIILPIGSSFGYFYPVFFVKSQLSEKSQLQRQIAQVNVHYIIFSFVVLFLSFFIKEKPPKFYEQQQTKEPNIDEQNDDIQVKILKRLIRLLKHKQFRNCMIIYIIKFQINLIYGQIMTTLYTINNYPSWLSSVQSIISCSCGTIGTVLYIKLFYTKNQTIFQVLICILGAIIFASKIILLNLQLSYMLQISLEILQGLVDYCLTGLQLEYIVLVTAFESKGFSNIILNFFTISFSLLFQLLFDLVFYKIKNLDDACYIISFSLSLMYLILIYYCSL